MVWFKPQIRVSLGVFYMKAYRKVNGEIREIRVDVSPSGTPLLPPNTTVDPRPEPLEGYYLDIVGDSWEQIPVRVHVPTLQEVKDKACDELALYKDWLLDSPVMFEGHDFDSDDTARIRLLGAVSAYQVSGKWPPAWVTYDNKLFPLTTPNLLNGLSMTVYNAFTSRFFFVTGIREQILACETIEEVDNVTIPEIGYVPPIPEPEEEEGGGPVTDPEGEGGEEGNEEPPVEPVEEEGTEGEGDGAEGEGSEEEGDPLNPEESEEEEGSEEGVEEPPLEDEGGVGTGDEGEGNSESNEEEEDPINPEESEEE